MTRPDDLQERLRKDLNSLAILSGHPLGHVSMTG